MSKKFKARSAGRRAQLTRRPASPDQPTVDRAQPQSVASRRQQRATAAIARRRRSQVIRWAGGITALALLLIGVVLYQQSGGSDGPSDSAGIPAPREEPEVAMDVNSLVGQPAPSFTLADSEDKTYTVTPGGDRPIVLITHMGIT